MIVKMYGFSLVTFRRYAAPLLDRLRGSGAAEFINLSAEKSVLARAERGPLAALPMTYAAFYMTYRAGRGRRKAGYADGANVSAHFLYTRQTVFMKGWTPENKRAAFERIVSEVCGDCCLFEYADAEYGDAEVPVMLKNNAFFSAFETLASPGDTPPYGRSDPTPALAALYFLFFGIIAGDAGVGLFLLLAAALALNNRALKARAHKFLRLLHFLGYSAAVFGTLYGKFFGYVFFAPLLTPDGFKPVVAAKHGVLTAFMLAAAFGALHAAAGYALKRFGPKKDGRRMKINNKGKRFSKFTGRVNRLKPRKKINLSPAAVYGLAARFADAAEKLAGHICFYALFAAFALPGGHLAAAGGAFTGAAGPGGTVLNAALTGAGGLAGIGIICLGVFVLTRRARFDSYRKKSPEIKSYNPF